MTADQHDASAPYGSNHTASLKWWLAMPFSVLGGLALDAAAPSVEWWPAGLIGATLILASLWQQKAAKGMFYGFVAGCAFWLPNISWLTLYLGPIPWVALSAVMVAWFALFGLLVSVSTRGISRLAISEPIVLVLQAFTVAGLWVAREQLQSTWPYGGFAWGRLAHTQAGGPFVSTVSWLGFAGFTGAIVFFCAMVVGAWFVFHGTRPQLISIGLTLALGSLFAWVPPAALENTGQIRIGAVQGNSKSGIFDDRENGDVFKDHVAETQVMLDSLGAENQHVDLIVWPENSGEFQLVEHSLRLFQLQALAKQAVAPVVAGTVLMDDDGVFTNSSVVIDESGFTGLQYDKRRPVPFAEYMPNRPFYHALVPELVDLVQLDYAFGTRAAVLPVETSAGVVRAGIAICFDIIFDDHSVAMMKGDAEVILAQTNNADFGRTDESAQQLQIARLRAVETGRALVNISTVGTSATVLPDGTVIKQLEPFTASSMVVEVPTVEGQTPAMHYGAIICAAWLLIACSGLLLGAYGLRR